MVIISFKSTLDIGYDRTEAENYNVKRDGKQEHGKRYYCNVFRAHASTLRRLDLSESTDQLIYTHLIDIAIYRLLLRAGRYSRVEPHYTPTHRAEYSNDFLRNLFTSDIHLFSCHSSMRIRIKVININVDDYLNSSHRSTLSLVYPD